MANILELARQQMQTAQQRVEEPKPTEHAQIVFNYNFASPAPIYRFNNAKKARKVYEDVVKAWRARQKWMSATGGKPTPEHLFEIKGDMFDGWIDLDHVAAINFVEWPKRDKFIPQPA